MRRIRTASVHTHARPAETEPAVTTLIELARDAGVTLFFDAEETAKHALPEDPFVVLGAAAEREVDLCFALGGDGTILTALRLYAGSAVPVFGINFGEMGFLATVDREEAWAGTLRALAGDFEVLSLPGIELSAPGGHRALAFNDVSLHRRQGLRVADLAYSVSDDEVGRVRCDGLVISTPAGSTGYNLANGGPVMAWGVHGYVVSFISPHSLTARTLVVAPGDRLAVDNRSREEPVDVIVDGRPVCELAAGERAQTRFAIDQGTLAQVPGTTFYHRLREKFGRLATPF
ncbi:MAG: NAD(+)/NADH kinase [Solirubrobacteraceae bacterium]